MSHPPTLHPRHQQPNNQAQYSNLHCLMNRNGSMNPAAGRFKSGDKPSSHQQRGRMPPQTTPPSTYFETRVLSLEEGHANLRGEVETLKEKYHELRVSAAKVKEVGCKTQVQSLPPTEPDQHHKNALEFEQELERLTLETRSPVHSEASHKRAQPYISKTKYSTPPHMRSASAASAKPIPPHMRKASKGNSGNAHSTDPNYLEDSTKHKHEPLVTDGPVDTIVDKPVRSTPATTPSRSPDKKEQVANPFKNVDAVAAEEWKPQYLTSLAKLSAGVLAKIPSQQNMVTFSPDFLSNTLGGDMWSPGMRFVKPSGPCMLKNRTYYTLDATHEPFLPKAPGEHGAKLTAFFNKSPEEEYDLDIKSYEDVPMFIESKDSKGCLRYAYFGDYSQTRWSDKLDNDTMRTRVPEHVKEHCARELTATPREQWIAEAIKKHFFPKPEYSGRLYAPPNQDDDDSVSTEHERNNFERMAKDVRKYVGELKTWERDATMKTAMIKKQTILDAFDAADADDPPALRLWWEYLECVDWRKDFYDMLVGLQSRDKQYL